MIQQDFISGYLDGAKMNTDKAMLIIFSDNVRYFSHIEKIEVARQVG